MAEIPGLFKSILLGIVRTLKTTLRASVFVGRLRDIGASLVEKVNVAAGNKLVAIASLAPPAIAVLEKWEVNGPVAGVYAIIVSMTMMRRYEQYGEVSRSIQEKGYDSLELRGEKKRLAQIYAERHGEQNWFRSAVERYNNKADSSDFY